MNPALRFLFAVALAFGVGCSPSKVENSSEVSVDTTEPESQGVLALSILTMTNPFFNNSLTDSGIRHVLITDSRSICNSNFIDSEIPYFPMSIGKGDLGMGYVRCVD